MNRALIEKATHRFCQRVEPGEDFPICSSLEWRDCADDVAPETHDFDGANFIPKPAPPPPPTVDELEAAAIAGTSTVPIPRHGFDLHRAFVAHVISTEAYRLGVAPSALTGVQLAAIRQRVANIYKALNGV